MAGSFAVAPTAVLSGSPSCPAAVGADRQREQHDDQHGGPGVPGGQAEPRGVGKPGQPPDEEAAQDEQEQESEQWERLARVRWASHRTAFGPRDTRVREVQTRRTHLGRVSVRSGVRVEGMVAAGTPWGGRLGGVGGGIALWHVR
jgi:hypothetical protein